MSAVRDGILKPVGYQQIANPAASTALTVPETAKYALLNCSAGTAIRFKDDGNAPTASAGVRLELNAKYWYTGDLRKIRVIQETAGTLEVLYYA